MPYDSDDTREHVQKDFQTRWQASVAVDKLVYQGRKKLALSSEHRLGRCSTHQQYTI